MDIFTGGSGAGWFFPDGFTQGGTNVARLSPPVVFNVRPLRCHACSSISAVHLLIAITCSVERQQGRWMTGNIQRIDPCGSAR